MAGCVMVSFAGTFKEAREFAAKHEGIHAPTGKAHHGDDVGLPMLSGRFKNIKEQEAISVKFTSLGWAPEFQLTNKYRPGKRRKP